MKKKKKKHFTKGLQYNIPYGTMTYSGGHLGIYHNPLNNVRNSWLRIGVIHELNEEDTTFLE